MVARVIDVIFRGQDGSLRATLTGSAAQIRGWENAVRGASGTSQKLGVSMQQGVALGATAVAAAFVYGVGKAIAFEKAMRNVNSLAHLSEAGLKSLSGQVLELSKRLPQSATDLAEGLYDISSSGFAGAKGMTILEASAEAASAGMSDTKTAAKAIVAVLNAYGLSASHAKDVSDVLFQTVNYGVVSFDELAGNLGDFIGAGAAAKIPIDQLTSALAAMTLTGISGAESATSLNQLISKLVKPSKALAGVYDELGYTSGSAALAQKGLRGVMVDIQKVTGGNIDSMLRLFPEIRAARGALALMTNEGRNYSTVSAQIQDRDARRGATLRTLQEQMKAAGNQMQVWKNKLDANLIEGGTRALPVLIALMNAAEGGGEALGRVGERLVQALAPTWQALSEIGANAGNIAGDLVDAFGPLVQLLATLSVGGAVVTLNAVATVLAVLTHLAAENATVTAVLVAMLGIRLVAGAVAAAGGLRALLVYRALLPMWYGMSGASDALAASMNRQALASKALNVGLTAAVAYVGVEAIRMFHELATAGDDTRDSLQGIYDQLGKNPSLDALTKAQQEVSKLQAQIDAPGAKSWTDIFRGAKFIADASAARTSLDELAAAQKRLSEQSLNMQRNLTSLSEVTGLSRAKITELAAAAGVDLTGSFLSAYNAIDAYQRKVAAGADDATRAKMIKALSDLADSAGDAEKKVKGLKDALDALMGGQLSLNEATRNWEAGFKTLSETLAKARGNLNLTTEGGRANSEAIDKQATSLRDLVVAQANSGATGARLNKTWDDGVGRLRATMSAAGFTKKQIDAYTASLGLVPGNVKTIVEAAGAGASAAEVKRLRDQIARLQSKTVTVTAVTNEVRNVVLNQQTGKMMIGRAKNAYGNVYVESYAGGGIRPLPKSAMIARNGPALVQWAEPGTGGEAFIPLAAGRRNRSEAILARVADMFGMRVERYAGGGYVNGRWVGPGKPTEKQRASEAARAAKAATKQSADALDRLYKRSADAGETRRLLAPVQLDVAFDVSGALGNITGRLEQMAHNQAELKARRSGNPYDSADDFYRAPKTTAHDLTLGLFAENKRAQRWQLELRKIAAVAGDDVAAQLEAMGERGMDAVHAMSSASAKDMQAMAAQMRALAKTAELSSAEWTRQLRADTGAQAAFQASLLKLIQRGRSDLAAKFSEMGADAAGVLASEAARSSDAVLAGMSRDLANNSKATDPQLASALKLAALLGQSGGKLGVVGLAGKSGMSVADVYALLVRYRAQVFSTLGGATRQVNADLALIAAGKEPSGLQGGGIVSGSGAASGRLFYRWAEPGSRGESLIPHDPANRDRATALWRATGQIIGAAPGSTAGDVTVVNVAPGAVQVSVPVNAGALTAAEVEARVGAAVTAANGRLLVTLRRNKIGVG